MTIVLTNDGGDIWECIQTCTCKYLSLTINDLTLSREVLDTLFERVVLIPFRDFSGHCKEAHECMKGIDEDDAPFLALGLSNGRFRITIPHQKKG